MEDIAQGILAEVFKAPSDEVIDVEEFEEQREYAEAMRGPDSFAMRRALLITLREYAEDHTALGEIRIHAQQSPECFTRENILKLTK